MTSRPKYQAITDLPRHIEEKLLGFNIMQLCALVSEKNGNRWTGASDRYGPIQEIARRWKADELFKRITDIPEEDDIVTYSRIMTAVGGNPSLSNPPSGAKPPPPSKLYFNKPILPEEQPKIKDKMKGLDPVALGLANCFTLKDLQEVAGEQKLDVNWTTVEGLKNFGLKRMFVGNKWRTKIRREAK